MAQHDLVDCRQIQAQNHQIGLRNEAQRQWNEAHAQHWPAVLCLIVAVLHRYWRWVFSQTHDGRELGEWHPPSPTGVWFSYKVHQGVNQLPSLRDKAAHRQAIWRLMNNPTNAQCHEDVELVISFLKTSGLDGEVLGQLVQGLQHHQNVDIATIRRKFDQGQAIGGNLPAHNGFLPAAQIAAQVWPAPDCGLAAAQAGPQRMQQDCVMANIPVDNQRFLQLERSLAQIAQMLQQQAQVNQRGAQALEQLQAEVNQLRDQQLGQQRVPLRFPARS